MQRSTIHTTPELLLLLLLLLLGTELRRVSTSFELQT
jgi:hypothetical protein